MFARGLTDRLGQSFVVENRAGGGGNIGFDAVAKSTPGRLHDHDRVRSAGHQSDHVRQSDLRSGARFRPDHHHRHLVAGARRASQGAGGQFRRIRRAGARAVRTRSMSARRASARPAISRSRCSAQAGVPLVHVPYRGAGPAVVDAVGGQIQATIVTLPATIGMIKQNQLRALAVTSSRRSRFAPEVAVHGGATAGGGGRIPGRRSSPPPARPRASSSGSTRSSRRCSSRAKWSMRSRRRRSRPAAARRRTSASSCATRPANGPRSSGPPVSALIAHVPEKWNRFSE